MGGYSIPCKPEALGPLLPSKPFSPRDPLTLGPRNPGTLEIIDTLLPTTSTGHRQHSEAEMGGGGAERVI